MQLLRVLNFIYGGSQLLMPYSGQCVSAAFLQKIRCGCSRWNDSFRVGHRSEELWLSRVDVFKDHDGGDVPAAVAVVGSRPHGDQLLIEHELVALVDKLVGSADQLQVVDVNKLQNEVVRGGHIFLVIKAH